MTLDRAVKPEPKGEIVFNLPEIKKITLSNGIGVYHVHKEELPIIKINFLVNAGGKLDPAGKKGLSYLTSMLIDEGAGEFDSMQLDNELESLGTIAGVSPGSDNIILSMLSLKEHFGRSLEIFSKVLTDPLLTEDDFEREKKNLVSRHLRLKDEPSFIASAVFKRKVFGGGKYAFPSIGFEKDVENISSEDVRDYYRSNFTPGNTEVVVAGNISAEELKSELEKHLGSWNTDSPESTAPAAEKFLYDDKKIYIVDRKDSAQSEVRVGHISKTRQEKDYFAKVIMNAILGGQFSSRINLNLREDKGYTYGAHSGFHYYRDSGYFSVSTSVQSENTAPALVEIIKELENIGKQISDEEIEFAKSYLVRKFPSSFETYGQVSSHLSNKVIHSLPENYYDNYISNIRNESPEAVLAAAKENIKPANAVIVIVGDKEKIYPGLKENFSCEIIETDYRGEPVDG